MDSQRFGAPTPKQIDERGKELRMRRQGRYVAVESVKLQRRLPDGEMRIYAVRLMTNMPLNRRRLDEILHNGIDAAWSFNEETKKYSQNAPDNVLSLRKRLGID